MNRKPYYINPATKKEPGNGLQLSGGIIGRKYSISELRIIIPPEM